MKMFTMAFYVELEVEWLNILEAHISMQNIKILNTEHWKKWQKFIAQYYFYKFKTYTHKMLHIGIVNENK